MAEITCGSKQLRLADKMQVYDLTDWLDCGGDLIDDDLTDQLVCGSDLINGDLTDWLVCLTVWLV